MENKEIKEVLYTHCTTFIKGRIQRLKSQITDMQESLTSETKSSAGDKHETGRAMIQLEIEKLGQQLQEAEKMQQVMTKVTLENSGDRAALSSVVQTNKVHYYLAISAGACVVDGETYYCISPHTPIGQLVLGKEKGATVSFNGQAFTIADIF